MKKLENYCFVVASIIIAFFFLSLFGGIVVQAVTAENLRQLVSPGLVISPDNMAYADPGATLTYTHQLTNTAATADTITLTVSSSAGFSAQVMPPTVALTGGASVTVTVTVTVATGVMSGTQGITMVTAVSGNDNTVSATAVNTTTVNLLPGLLAWPPAQEQVAMPASNAQYTYAITNTGNWTDTYYLSLTSSQGYTASVNVPSLTLAPGVADWLTVTVSVPADAEADTMDQTVLTLQSGNVPILTRSVTSTTHVGAIAGIAISPNNQGSAFPGQTAVYTHTVRNLGNRTETVSLTATSSQGWPVIVQPNTLTLARNSSGVVTVTLSVPPAAASGISDTTTVTATISGSSATVTNITTVRYHHLFLPLVLRPAEWTRVGDWPADRVALSLAVCPSNESRMIAGGLGANARVWVLQGTTWSDAQGNNAPPIGYSVTAVVMNQSCDTVYIGLYDQGVWQGVHNGGAWTWSRLGGDEVKLVRTLALAGDQLFAGGEFGIRYWQNNNWQETNITAGNLVMYISAAQPDTSATSLYAVQWQSSQIYRAIGTLPTLWGVLPLPALPDNLTRVVFGTTENVRFVGTNERSFQLVNNSWQQINVQAGLRAAVIEGDSAYLGFSLSAGVYKLQGGALTPINAGWSTNPQFVYVLTLAEGQLYAATTTGVWVYQRP